MPIDEKYAKGVIEAPLSRNKRTQYSKLYDYLNSLD